MKKVGRAFKVNFTLFPEVILFIGLIIFIGGALQYAQGKKSSSVASNPSDAASPALMERKLAIEQAIKEGKSEYSYSTNFVPGLGRISDPDAYKKQWEEDTKKQLSQPN